ncbi:hypothetical protein MKX03_012378 [Papaver bracteatum]|nr:hypothetical protein MKX03_012378 [Papaver bracteatum]
MLTLQDKTSGKILYKHGGLLVLYRGRHYKTKERPVIPSLFIQEMRKRGLSVLALAKLVENGYYGNLVPMVRDAFLTEEMVRIDCKGLNKSDYKKIGYKLRVISHNSFDCLVGGSSHTVEEEGSFSNDNESSSSEDELLSSDSKLFGPPIR